MKKAKKRCHILLVVIVLCVGMISPTKVFADETTYRLEDLELEITIPSGYSAITKDTPDNAPIFSEIGMTKSDYISFMESGSCYMDVFSDDFTEEIVVTMQPNDFPDFNSLSDDDLSVLAEKFMDVDLSSDYGYDMKYFDYKIYEHSQTKFIIEYFTDSANSVYGLQYYTIYEDKAMNFTLRSYTGPISETQEKWMKKLVDNVKFDGEYVNFGHGQEIEESNYIDAVSGVKFTVPENWVEQEISKEAEFVNAKYGYTLDVAVFSFSSIDMWEQMSAAEKIGFDRSDINNSMFSMELIEEMFTATHGITPKEIYQVTYNGKEYYEGVVTKNIESDGVTTEAEFTILLRFDNGWGYMFDFGQKKDANLHNDFEQIMNSVEYPESVGMVPTSSTNSALMIVVLVPIAILILAIVFIVLIVIMVNRKKQSNNDSFEYKPVFSGQIENDSQTIFCRNCGKELPKDSAFCHHCGTKIDV